MTVCCCVFQGTEDTAPGQGLSQDGSVVVDRRASMTGSSSDQHCVRAGSTQRSISDEQLAHSYSL